MRYFMYSPVDMSEQEAFQLAKPYLKSDHIVEIGVRFPYIRSIDKRKRPTAASGTYLVRVEPDDSLRIVDRKL